MNKEGMNARPYWDNQRITKKTNSSMCCPMKVGDDSPNALAMNANQTKSNDVRLSCKKGCRSAWKLVCMSSAQMNRNELKLAAFDSFDRVLENGTERVERGDSYAIQANQDNGKGKEEKKKVVDKVLNVCVLGCRTISKRKRERERERDKERDV